MSHPRQHPEPFWREPTSECYYVQIGKKQHRLAQDRDEAYRRYHELMSRPADATPCRPPPSRISPWRSSTCSSTGQQEPGTRTYDAYRAAHLRRFHPDRHPRAGAKAAHVTRVMDDHAERWSNNTKNDFATTVQRPFNWAFEEGLIDRNPLARVRKPARRAGSWRSAPPTTRDHGRGEGAGIPGPAGTGMGDGCTRAGARTIEARHSIWRGIVLSSRQGIEGEEAAPRDLPGYRPGPR